MTDARRPSSAGRRLDVSADLSIDVDGTSARLTGDGGRLVLTSDHPERVWAALTGAALPAAVGRVDGPRAVGRLASALSDAGVELHVTGPRGTVVRLGAGGSSPVGRAVTGSAAVRPGAPAAVAVVLWQERRRAALAAAAVLVAIGAAAGVRGLARRG